MPKRSESYDEYVAQKMQNLDYARAMFMNSLEDFGESVEEALKYTIKNMGIKEFSEKAGIPLQNVSEFVRGKRNLKLQTLNKYLAVFKLKSKVIVVEDEDVA